MTHPTAMIMVRLFALNPDDLEASLEVEAGEELVEDTLDAPVVLERVEVTGTRTV